MKIGGQEVSGPTEEVLVLPRVGGDVVFKAQAVLDMEPFYAACPAPKAPGHLTKDGFKQNTKAPAYREQMGRHATLRFAYIVINSLIPSDIEWQQIEEDKPHTWLKWEDELKEAGFSNVEIQRITVCVMQANSLDEGKLKAARDAFLQGQGAASEASSGQNTEQLSTPSGEAASGSE